MGFPVDWALRAAEHCDASISESAAISWIIERMELEQAKLDEFEGSDSRMVDEDEYDEHTTSGSFEQLHRVTLGQISGGESRGLSNSVMNRGVENGSTQKPDAAVQFSADIHEGSSGTVSSTGTSIDILSILRSNDEYGVSFSPVENMGVENGLWNLEYQYNSINPRKYCSRQKVDSYNQEVLYQLSDLDTEDLYPIVVACEFSLCVVYARYIIAKIIKLAVQHKKCSHFLSILLNPSNQNRLSFFLPICFKLGLKLCSQPEKLFPCLVDTMNTSGNCKSKIPFLSPFVGKSVYQYSIQLLELEIAVFKQEEVMSRLRPTLWNDNSISRLGAVASDESWLQASNTCKIFLNHIFHCSVGSGTSDMENVLRSRILVQQLFEDAIIHLESASQSQYERCDWISGLDNMGGNIHSLLPFKSSLSAESQPASEILSHSFVLWGYFILKTFLDSHNSISVSQDYNEDPGVTSFLSLLWSSTNTMRILKLICSLNITLRYCVLDITASFLSKISERAERSAGIETNNMLSQFVVEVLKESKIHKSLATRWKFEILNRKTVSRYTAVVLSFLHQWRRLEENTDANRYFLIQ